MISLGILSDFTDDERSKLQQACDLANRILSTQAFAAAVSVFQFDSTALYPAYLPGQEDNASVLKSLAEDATITRLYCEDLGWWATHWDRTIAEESPDGTVTFNRAFFDDQTIPSLANTLVHEFCHVLGYWHQSADDTTSVPYGVGNLVEQVAGGT